MYSHIKFGIYIFVIGFILSITMGFLLGVSSSITGADLLIAIWTSILYLASIVVICTSLILKKDSKN